MSKVKDTVKPYETKLLGAEIKDVLSCDRCSTKKLKHVGNIDEFGEANFVQRNLTEESWRKLRFAICSSCFWCATLIGSFDLMKCPLCSSPDLNNTSEGYSTKYSRSGMSSGPSRSLQQIR